MRACGKIKERSPAQNMPTLCRKVAEPQRNKKSDDIVGRYLKGNFHERLDLWLTHRDLRPTLSRLNKAMYDE